jgi:CRISPR-associated endonuclease/helicase Cas3
MLSDFVVGTVAQVLLAALKQKHVMMRHLGLANKVVIIDECHAYDAYMGVYLQRVLQWLGAYHVPVIILSATLPKETRKKLIDAYLNKKSKSLESVPDWMRQEYGEPEREEWAESTDYPLITYTDGQIVEQRSIQLEASRRTIELNHIDESELMSLIEERLSNGGCAGIIVNTVSRAQQIARQCAEVFGENTIRLLHASFLMPDRTRIEREITELLGKPKADRIRPQKLIVVGTQVLEQSLDIDFDLLITDWCPMDLLLQRMGRLHRHLRDNRPTKISQPVCFILNGNQPDFDRGTKSIYGEYLLMRTRAFFPKQIHIPDDISTLVQNVYDENILLEPSPENYSTAFETYLNLIKHKESRANAFCLNQPEAQSQKRKKRSKYNRLSAGQSMVGCFDKLTSDSEDGEAAVRDIQQESIEVILLHIKDGMLCLFDEKNTQVPRNQTPDDELAMQMAQNTVKLPSKMSYFERAAEAVRELEIISLAPSSDYKLFQKSKWLKGSLFLIFDENNHADLLNNILTYSHEYGLECYDKEDVHA